MKINPNLKKINTIFYNNICIIMLIFSVICFYSAMTCLNNVKTISRTMNTQKEQIIGPIVVDKNPKIYQVEASFYGNNSSADFSAEVLDENKDTLYEIGKDFWHESGYDSEGYYSEGSDNMVARLNFYKKGNYYIKFPAMSSNNKIEIVIKKPKGSYVPYFLMGFWLVFFALFAFCINNKELLQQLNNQMKEEE